MIVRSLLLASLIAAALPAAAQTPTATPAPATTTAAPADASLVDVIKKADDFTATWNLTGGGRNATGKVWFQRPGKVRVETGSMQLVSDGEQCILVMHDSKSFLGGPVDWPLAGGGTRSGELPFFASAMLQPQAILDLLEGVKSTNATFVVDDSGVLATIPASVETEEDTKVRYSELSLGTPPAEGWFDTKGPADYRNVTGLAAKPSFQAMELVDKPAPGLGGIPIDGQRKSLADLRGNVVVVDFWASWCAPCLTSLPETARLARELAGQGVIFVGVNTDEMGQLDKARAIVASKNIDFPQVFGNNDVVSANWKIQSLPTVFVVRPDGRVHAVHVGLFGEDESLADLIAEARKATPAGPQPLPAPEATAEPAVAPPAAP